MRDLGDFLAQAGAIVGGGAALGATIGFIAGSALHDFRPETDPELWARRLAAFGGTFGLVILILDAVESAREAANAEIRRVGRHGARRSHL